MRLKTLRETSDIYTGKVSDISRHLAMTAIALIWIFKVDKADGSWSLDTGLTTAAFLVAISLICDFLQYLYGGIAWSAFHASKEKADVSENTDFKAPRWINYPTNSFYFAKVVSVLVAYFIIANFILARISDLSSGAI